jgi:hypothetical protein
MFGRPKPTTGCSAYGRRRRRRRRRRRKRRRRRSTLIYSNLSHGQPSGFFPVLATKTQRVRDLLFIRATCPSSFIILDLLNVD